MARPQNPDLLIRTLNRMQLEVADTPLYQIEEDIPQSSDIPVSPVDSIHLNYPTSDDSHNLTPNQLRAIEQSWHRIRPKQCLIRPYLSDVFKKPEARRPFFVPLQPTNGKSVDETVMFNRHVFLQTVSFTALIEYLHDEHNLKLLAQNLGHRHTEFARVVVMESWLWNHILDCFMVNLEKLYHEDDENTRNLMSCWRRLLVWFYSNINIAYQTKLAFMKLRK